MSFSFKNGDKDTGVIGEIESIDALVDGQVLNGTNISRGPHNLRVRTEKLKEAVERLEFMNAQAFFSTLVLEGNVLWHGPDDPTASDFVYDEEGDSNLVGTLEVTDPNDAGARGSLTVKPAGTAGTLRVEGETLWNFLTHLEDTSRPNLLHVDDVLYLDIPDFQERLNRDANTHSVALSELKNSRNLQSFDFIVATSGSVHGISAPAGSDLPALRAGSTVQLPIAGGGYVKVTVSRVEDGVAYFNTLEDTELDENVPAVENLPVDAIPLAVVLEDDRLALKNGVALSAGKRGGRAGTSLADLLVDASNWTNNSALGFNDTDATLDAFVTAVDGLLATHEALLQSASGDKTDLPARVQDIDDRLSSRETELDSAVGVVDGLNAAEHGLADVVTHFDGHVEDDLAETIDEATSFKSAFNAHGLGKHFFRKEIAFPATTEDHLIGWRAQIPHEFVSFSYGMQPNTNTENAHANISVSGGNVPLNDLFTFAQPGTLTHDNATFDPEDRAQLYTENSDPEESSDGEPAQLLRIVGGRLRNTEFTTDPADTIKDRTSTRTASNEVLASVSNTNRFDTDTDFRVFETSEGVYDVTDTSQGLWSLVIEDGDLEGVYRIDGVVNDTFGKNLQLRDELPTTLEVASSLPVRLLPPPITVEFNGLVKGGFSAVYPTSGRRDDEPILDKDGVDPVANGAADGYVYLTTYRAAVYVGQPTSAEGPTTAGMLEAGYRVMHGSDRRPVSLVEVFDGVEWVDVTESPNYGDMWYQRDGYEAGAATDFRLKVDLDTATDYSAVTVDVYIVEGVQVNSFPVTGDVMRIGELLRPVYIPSDDQVNTLTSIANAAGVRFDPDITLQDVNASGFRLFKNIWQVAEGDDSLATEAFGEDPLVRPFVVLDKADYLEQSRANTAPARLTAFFGSLAPIQSLATNPTALLVQGKTASDTSSAISDQIRDIRGDDGSGAPATDLQTLNGLLNAATNIRRVERLSPEIPGLILRTCDSDQDRGKDYTNQYRHPGIDYQTARSNLMLYAGELYDATFHTHTDYAKLRVSDNEADDSVLRGEGRTRHDSPFATRPVYYVERETTSSSMYYDTLFLRFGYNIPRAFTAWERINVDLYHNLPQNWTGKPAVTLGLARDGHYGEATTYDGSTLKWPGGAFAYDYVLTSHGLEDDVQYRYTPIEFTPDGDSGTEKLRDDTSFAPVQGAYSRKLPPGLTYAGNQLVFTVSLNALNSDPRKVVNALGEVTIDYRESLLV